MARHSWISQLTGVAAVVLAAGSAPVAAQSDDVPANETGKGQAAPDAHLDAAEAAGYDFESVDPENPFPDFPFEDFSMPDTGNTLSDMLDELSPSAREEVFYRCVVVTAQPVRYGETFTLQSGTEVEPAQMHNFCEAVVEAQPVETTGERPAAKQEDDAPDADSNGDAEAGDAAASDEAAALPDGSTVFASVGCTSCHGPSGGGGVGPELTGNSFLRDSDDVIDVLLNGRGSMPPFSNLSDPELAAVTNFLRTELNDYSGETTADEAASHR